MNQRTAFLAGAGIDAAVMYVIDPERGRRRRALARDKLVSAITRADDAIAATARDLANRARGIAAETRNRFSREDVPDAVLAERVRSELGRCSSQASSMTVTASNG